MELITTIIASSVTAAVTIIGFFVSTQNIKKSLSGDLKKVQAEKTLDRSGELSLEIIQIMSKVLAAGNDENKMAKAVEELNECENKILAFGGPKSVKICCYAQENMYASGAPFETLAALSLLIVQLKLDLSGDITSPESWFKLKIKDYHSKKEIQSDIQNRVNNIVDKLELDKRFEIKNV